MVEAQQNPSGQAQDGDGIERLVQYARFRTDKPAQPGYTADLMHINCPEECYDDLNQLPQLQSPYQSILDVFLAQVKSQPTNRFLGTRVKNADETFGEYQWMSYGDVNTIYEEIARGCKQLDLLNPIEGVNEDGKEWAFCGIWSKNRWEWHVTMLSAMVCRATIVGFYDSMGDSSVDYCLKQTKLQTLFVSSAYLAKVLGLREKGMATFVQNVVLFDTDEDTPALIQRAQDEFQIRVLTLDEVRETGRQSTLALQPELIKRDDVYMLNYTSGTTGDSKGVKMSHWGILGQALIMQEEQKFDQNDVAIDYLPAPHVFDQFMFLMIMVCGGSQGYFQGNPLKLTEDCKLLQPTLFPSVPRLYNKIYSKIKAKFDDATGCKRWLIDKALASKSYYLNQTPAQYHSNVYDPLVFSKVAAELGGRVKFMVTGSAPISKEVLDFLKIGFCCPIQEAYGLSECQGACTLTRKEDPISGTIGGPVLHCAIRLKDLPDMDYRITDKPYPRGEICLRGPCITTGYFMRPDKTAEAIDEYGYLNTGDVGVVFPNGSIQILDRSKNIFKLSQGEYVAPEKVENIYIQSAYIAQCMVYGDSFKNCCVAIVVPEPDKLKDWAAANGKDPDDVIKTQDEAFKAQVLLEINELGKKNALNSLEKPKEIYIALEAFSVENDILTPTFKLKRNVGKKIYQAQIDAMYEALAARGL